jgi:hypothetical protein
MPLSPSTHSFLSRVVNRFCPEDPQAIVTLTSALVLLGSLVAIVTGIVHQLWVNHPIDWGTVGVFTVALAAPCALARIKAPSLPFPPQSIAGESLADSAAVNCAGTQSTEVGTPMSTTEAQGATTTKGAPDQEGES